MKRNGYYANGKQRWWCNNCNTSFHWSNTTNKHIREQKWFRLWLQEGYSVRQLQQQSNHKHTKLYAIINYWLTTPPPVETSSLQLHKHLIFDGTFLHRPTSIVVLMDATNHTIVAGQYGIRENSITQLLQFFVPLKKRGLNPVSCTVDGNPQVITVLQQLWPKMYIQRCVVHIQRQGLMWCRRNPKRTDAQQVRKLFSRVTYISSCKERDVFIADFMAWEQRFGSSLALQPERGKVLSDVKRARSMLLKALPNMFYYLDNASIPNSTNGLEGYFSRLKAHYRQHRGLAPHKLTAYFAWYFCIRNR